MLLPRVISLVMISASVAAQAQQQPAATPQPTGTTAAKPDNSQKRTCRIEMDGTMPRRVCMTNSEWAKLDGGDPSKLPDATYQDRLRCTSMGAC
jgi:hypothetical protein